MGKVRSSRVGAWHQHRGCCAQGARPPRCCAQPVPLTAAATAAAPSCCCCRCSFLLPLLTPPRPQNPAGRDGAHPLLLPEPGRGRDGGVPLLLHAPAGLPGGQDHHPLHLQRPEAPHPRRRGAAVRGASAVWQARKGEGKRPAGWQAVGAGAVGRGEHLVCGVVERRSVGHPLFGRPAKVRGRGRQAGRRLAQEQWGEGSTWFVAWWSGGPQDTRCLATRAHAHSVTRTRTCTHTCACTCTHSHTYTHTYTHTHTYTCTNTHTHAHTHTCTHTLARPTQVSTVDKYQGQQNDYVLLSLVRTRVVGHFRDVRRLVSEPAPCCRK